ncbi:hypothetical protein [Methylophilus aquaticus]|uniref:Methyl-accepting chemotaxis protein n=1 Tax=Methylophilus aquaticus TaxID=1971610 RepID=A0ABT9JV64_9PROT|nr:hypothetical protein [Methylophilus aquaticus]MDP8568458.1 hypothetical protein [Methylophilus aquaticus]
MAIQFLPILKAVAPYIAQVATAAIPAFTSKPEAAKVDPLLTRQIEELQAATIQNAESLHLLAEKMQLAIQALEEAGQEAKKQVAAYKTMLFASLGLAMVTAIACVYLLLR